MSDGGFSGAPRAIGDPTPFGVSWRLLVDSVVAATALACGDLAASGEVDASWSEDQTTIRLGDFLEIRLPAACQFEFQHCELTAGIRDGSASLLTAKRPDLAVSCRRHRPHATGRWFLWEAKRVLDPADGEAYVKDGMVRHVDGRYSRPVDDGGMLAYLHRGDATSFRASVNGVIATGKCLPKDELLSVPGDAAPSVERCQSNHERPVVGRRIALNHLMVSFGK